MSEPAERLMTVAEFLTWDDGTDTRYELVDGRPVAMAPPAAEHSVILSKLVIALGARLRPPCYSGSQAGVPSPTKADNYYVADFVVSCTPLGSNMSAVPEPVVIGEILSPTTENHDRGRKANDYRRIDSVQAIVLVASERRHIEVWRRRGSKWEIEDLIGDAELELNVLARPVPLAEIYADSGV